MWALPVIPADAEGGSVSLGPGAEEAGELLGLDLLGLLEAQKATGKTGEVITIPVVHDDVQVLLLVGVGQQSVTDFRRAGATLARATKDRASVVTSITAIAPDEGLGAFVVGAMLGSFGFHWRSTGPAETPVARIVLGGTLAEVADEELARALAAGGAGWRSRLLATVPSNLKSPAWLAQQAEELARRRGPRGRDLGRGTPRRGRLRRRARRRRGIGVAAPPDPPRLHAARRHQEDADRGARRQGHHLRHRRPRHQASRRHADDEARHVGRRRGAGHHGRAARRAVPGAGDRPRARPPRTPSAVLRCGPAT